MTIRNNSHLRRLLIPITGFNPVKIILPFRVGPWCATTCIPEDQTECSQLTIVNSRIAVDPLLESFEEPEALNSHHRHLGGSSFTHLLNPEIAIQNKTHER